MVIILSCLELIKSVNVRYGYGDDVLSMEFL